MTGRQRFAFRIFRLFVPAFGLAALGTGAARASSDRIGCADCNVILVSLDTLRADALGAYGSKLGASPAIDRAARRGFTFLNAYSPATSTLPSHMSVFSGLYPVRHNIKNSWREDKLRASDPTLAEILKSRGYRTVWAWTAPYLSVDPMISNPHGGHGRGFDDFINETFIRDEKPSTAFEWLESNASNRFFMFLHNYRMHQPYTPSRRAMKKFSNTLYRKDYLTLEAANQKIRDEVVNKPELVFSSDTIAHNPDVFGTRDPDEKWAKIQRHLSRLGYTPHWFHMMGDSLFWSQFDVTKPEDVSDLKALYSMRLYDLDEWFEGLIAKLRALKILDKTLIVVMSDHGEEFAEHGGFSHSQVHEECVRIPLIFLFPGRGGKAIPDMASNIDIYPTVLDALGMEIPGSIQGVSLLPLVEGGTGPGRRPVFSGNYARSMYSVRDATRSYIVDRSSGLAEKFYDRAADPGETRNLIGTPGESGVDPYRRLIRAYLGEK